MQSLLPLLNGKPVWDRSCTKRIASRYIAGMSRHPHCSGSVWVSRDLVKANKEFYSRFVCGWEFSINYWNSGSIQSFQSVRVVPRTIISSTGNARVDAEAWGEVAGSGVFPCVYLGHLGASPTPDEEKQYYYHPMGLERRCFCKRERCVEKIGPCKPCISPAEWTH